MNFIESLFGAKVVTAPDDDAATTERYDTTTISDTEQTVNAMLATLVQGIATVIVAKAAPSWASTHELVGTTPVRLVQANPRRRAVTIVSKGLIAISNTQNVRYGGPGTNQGTGELWAGDTLTLETTDEVWAVAPTSGQDVMVYQLLEDG